MAALVVCKRCGVLHTGGYCPREKCALCDVFHGDGQICPKGRVDEHGKVRPHKDLEPEFKYTCDRCGGVLPDGCKPGCPGPL